MANDTQTRAVSELTLHPRADLVPVMDPDAYNELLADIEQHGVQTPLDILDDGTILDGRTRWQIAGTLGLDEVPFRVVEPDDAVAYMIRMALLRRHLSTAQRKALAAELLAAQPTRSNRDIATTAKVDEKTVRNIRTTLVEEGKVEEVSTVVGTDGVEQPARKATTKPKAPKPGITSVEDTKVAIAEWDAGVAAFINARGYIEAWVTTRGGDVDKRYDGDTRIDRRKHAIDLLTSLEAEGIRAGDDLRRALEKVAEPPSGLNRVAGASADHDVAVTALKALEPQVAAELSESLARIGNDWSRQIDWAIEQGVPAALGMTDRAWIERYAAYLFIDTPLNREVLVPHLFEDRPPRKGRRTRP